MKQKKGWSLRYRSDKKRWVLSVEPADGGRQWRTHTAPEAIKREVDAKAWAAGVLSQRALEGPIAPKASPTARITGATVRVLYASWIEDAEKRVEKATGAGYKTAFKAWILPMLGDEAANGLDIPRLRAWVKDLREQKAKRGGKKVTVALDGRALSPMRVANTFSALSVFLSDMIADRRVTLTSNPCLDEAVRRQLPERPRPGQVRIAGSRPGVPTMGDGQVAIDAAEDEAFRVRLIIGFGQGFRDGEISGLRLSRVDLNAEVPHFVISEAVKLKGPSGHATPGKVKTTSSQRVVPMHPAVAEAIRDWLANGWRERMRRAPQPNDFLLPGADGGPARPRSSELFRDALVAARQPTERAGKAVTFRSARNAFATALAEADVPREARKLLMGHTPDDVDEAHYTAHALSKLAGYVARLPLTWTSRSATPAGAIVGGDCSASCSAVCLASGQAEERKVVELLSDPGQSRTADQRFRKTERAWPSMAVCAATTLSAAADDHPNNGTTCINGLENCSADGVGQAVLGRGLGELKGLRTALDLEVFLWDLWEATALGEGEGAVNDTDGPDARRAGGAP